MVTFAVLSSSAPVPLPQPANLGDEAVQLHTMAESETAVGERFEAVDVVSQAPCRPVLLHVALDAGRAVASLACVDTMLWCGLQGAIAVLDALTLQQVCHGTVLICVFYGLSVPLAAKRFRLEFAKIVSTSSLLLSIYLTEV